MLMIMNITRGNNSYIRDIIYLNIMLPLSSSLPCRKADFISVVFNVQFLRTAIEISNLTAPLPTVGLSLGISRSFSSNPLTTNLALVCPFLFVMTHLVYKPFVHDHLLPHMYHFSSSFTFALTIFSLSDFCLFAISVMFILVSCIFSHSCLSRSMLLSSPFSFRMLYHVLFFLCFTCST